MGCRLGADNGILFNIVALVKRLAHYKAVFLEFGFCYGNTQVGKILNFYLTDTLADLYSHLGAYLYFSALCIFLIEYLVLVIGAPLLLGIELQIFGVLGICLVPAHSSKIRHEELVVVSHAYTSV
ncbi:unknown [Eubacterium sp. CAG:786]|nr:unknown [Eubacterium sp. CAG:786]